MRTVLVTGASGFVGGHVVAALARSGVRPRCLVRAGSRLDFIREWSPEYAIGDVSSPESLATAVEGVDGIVHCAGVTRAAARRDFRRVNEEGSRNLYLACLAGNPGVRRIVHIGSLAALGPSVGAEPVAEGTEPHPVSEYGRSKLAGQGIAEGFMARLPIAVLIPPAVYGPFDRDFLKTFALMRRGLFLTIGGAERRLSLVYAGDLARAVLACMDGDAAVGKRYIVEDGRPRTWTELSAAIAKTMGVSPVRIPVPAAALGAWCAAAGFAARCLGRTTVFNRDKFRELSQPAWTCSAARIRAELGFAARCPLEQGLEETYRWYVEHRWL